MAKAAPNLCLRQGSIHMHTRGFASLQLFIDRLTTRSVLNAEEKQAILGLPTRTLEVKARRDFVHEGEATEHGCFVASGIVGRFGQTSDGLRQITAFHVAGEMVDLHSAVRPTGVGGLTALCDTVILRIPHRAIRALAAQYPAIAEAFWRDCMLDAAILMQWVVNVGRRDARTRLAHIFCEMAVRHGGDRDPATQFHFPVTQIQLGEAAGLTSVHVNRTLRALEYEGFLTAKHGRVQINDWKALAKMAEFDPTYLVADIGPNRQKRLIAA